MPAVVASAGYPGTLEVILGGAQVQGQPGLYSEFQQSGPRGGGGLRGMGWGGEGCLPQKKNEEGKRQEENKSLQVVRYSGVEE